MIARALTLLAVGATVLAAPAYRSTCHAAKKKRAAGVAFFPVHIKGKANEALVRGVEQEIINKARSAAISIIYGPTLVKRVRDAAQAARRCADNGMCLGKLGKRARVTEVIAGKAVAARSGVRITFKIIDVGSNRVVRKVQLEVVKAEQIEMTVSAHFIDLFGVADASETEADLVMPALEDLSLPPAEPEATAAAAGTDTTEPAQRADPAAADGADPELALVALEAPPDEAIHGAGGSETIEARGGDDGLAGDSSTTGHGRDVSHAGGATGRPPKAAERTRIFLYTGIAIAAVGAIGVGVGGIFGLMRNDAATAADRTRPGGDYVASQPKAVRLGIEATAHADRANAMFIAGGAAVAIGAILMGLDALVFDDSGASAAVSSGGSATSLILRW